MRLPRDILLNTYTKPQIFLCEVDKTMITELETTDTIADLKFNAYSEIEFTIGRTYTDIITGEERINPYYDKVQALRLLKVGKASEFGFFEIQDPEIITNGIKEEKHITAYSLEYSLSQKYLENFIVNKGTANSIEQIYAEVNGLSSAINVTFCNWTNTNLSLVHLILEKIYGWKIGHVDASLIKMERSFEISRESVYDFIMQELCESFNCYAIFDTVENTISFYAESDTHLLQENGDGEKTSFALSIVYDSISEVKVNGYRTREYTYDPSTGIITFNTPPESGAQIEVKDGSQEKWMTDVFVSFDNLAQEANISYSADDIKTVLTVRGAEDLDIREVNFGLPYIVDLSYYYSVDWMGQELYDAYTAYLKKCETVKAEYTQRAAEILEQENYYSYEMNRLSLQYSIASHVTSETRGTYYVRGGTAPNYYYTEVKLPADYSADVEHYYSLSGNDLTEAKFSKFYKALKTYYKSENSKTTTDIEALADDFAFMETNTIASLCVALKSASSTSEKDNAVAKFLDELWNQLGVNPLQKLYYDSYKKTQDTNIEAGWNDSSNENYWLYYPVTVVLDSLDRAITKRKEEADKYANRKQELAAANAVISSELLISNNFTEKQLIRLSAFLREDEYSDENFVETESDTIATLLRTKKELLECGKIELSKLSAPKLEFSMDMANIYALPEFTPIIDQFQLGNLINVVIRSDYIKQARLLEVNINFDDFSDFSCEFGELTSIRTPSSIHADLLASAVSAGKSVASNASYWDRGANLATATDLKIQQGLLGATTEIKAIDGTQGVSIDKYGIKKIVPLCSNT